jgi:signal transduction histidine kinase
MLESAEEQATTRMLDACPIQMDFMRNWATKMIPPASRSDRCQKNSSSIDWLSASIIHDLRNPVTTVLAGAEMLLQIDPASPQVKRLAANIYRAANRMCELLEDVAGLTCGNKLPSEICKIRDVIFAASRAALPAAETQRDQILHDVPDGLEIPVERCRLERVFFNLITNAIEAMPHGGKIRIEARRSDNSVLIEVEDTGPGIPRRIRGRLFEPFVTAGKAHGLGLGLALSRQTVLEHGGDMWTEPAAGARFVVSLPLKKNEDVPGQTARASKNPTPEKTPQVPDLRRRQRRGCSPFQS